MAEYSILLNGRVIVEVDGIECAYQVYRNTIEIADIIGGTVRLQDNRKVRAIATYGYDY